MTSGHTAAQQLSGATRHAPPVDQSKRILGPCRRRVRISDIARHASVIRVLAARDFKVKYKQSVLGPVWLVFQPLGLLLAFLVAFHGLGNVKSSGVPYVVFALCGLAAWSFFQAAMTIGTPSMISNVNLVRYTPCPRVAPLASSVIASLPSFGITGGAAVIGAALTGHLSVRVLLLPFGVLWLIALTFGAVAFFAALSVRYRDAISALPFLLQLGTFFAPVGYALSRLSPDLRILVELSPMTGVIEAFRWIILSGYHADLAAIVPALVVSTAVIVLGWQTFTARETTMADVI